MTEAEPGNARRWAGAILTILALGAIAAATLRSGDPSVLEDHGHWCLVCGSQGTVDVIQNLLLFAPLGAGLAILGLPLSLAIAAAAATSLGVESVQATVLVGRAATLSDVVTNTAGATAAYLVTLKYRGWLLPRSAWALPLSSLWTAAWVAACLAGAWALLPAPSAGPYIVQRIPPESGHLREFEGTILDARIGQVKLERDGNLTPGDGRLDEELRADAVAARARVSPMQYAPGKLRPVVSVHDTAWRANVVLGQRQTDLVFTLRLNSARLRLRTPSARLADVFPGTSERSERRTAQIALEGEWSREAVLLRSASTLESRERRLSVTPLLAWSVLAPFDLADSPRTWWMTFLWMVGWLFPVGYWSAGAWSSRGGTRVTAIPTVLIALSAPWIAAPTTGVSQPEFEWLFVGALLLLAGGALGAFVARSREGGT